MKCPYCFSEFSGTPRYCPNCRQPLSRADSTFRKAHPVKQSTSKGKLRFHIPVLTILRVLFVLACIIIATIGLYKLYYWVANYRIDRLYTRGEYTPTINPVTMEDSRVGHTFVFYGAEGDTVYVPELNKSLSICGGTARMTVPDADWFTGDVTEIESAEIVLTPILITEKGVRTQLPAMKFSIDVPSSPLSITAPAKNGISTLTSRYEISADVVPGSTVYINGEDVTSRVTKGGELTQNVIVQPIGTNTYSVVVRTKNHKETRQDVEIYRAQYPITVELDASVKNKSTNDMMAITGTTEPGCSLVVETAFVEDSVQIDQTTGQFAFIAKLSNYGDNIVRFRITRPGTADDVLSMTVEYSPTLAAYSAKAWATDYPQLSQLYEQWVGRVFLCRGKVVAVYNENGKTYMVMDVSDNESGQLVILENHSKLKTITSGSKYSCYADVTGRMMYNAAYYPALCARYVETMA